MTWRLGGPTHIAYEIALLCPPLSTCVLVVQIATKQNAAVTTFPTSGVRDPAASDAYAAEQRLNECVSISRWGVEPRVWGACMLSCHEGVSG